MSAMAASLHATLFPTAIGACCIAWRQDVVIATHLPEATEAETWQRLAGRAGPIVEAVPPPAIAGAIAAVTALMQGERVHLATIALDMASLDPFRQAVYAAARAIPPGETRTYGQIADQLGGRQMSQAVGKALGQNPFPIIVPCHRVMGADGRLTGFSATGGVNTKLRMLAIERAVIGETPSLFGDLPLAIRPR